MLKRLALAAASLLVGCGGGGGSGGSLSISLSPNPLTTTFQQWDGPKQLVINGHLDGPSPSGPFVILVTFTGDAFQPGATTVNLVSQSDATAFLDTAIGLPAGDHSGSIQVQICGDPSCSGTVYASGSLPYDITVQPNPVLTAAPTPTVVTATMYQGDTPSWNAMFTLQGTPVAGTSTLATGSDPAGLVLFTVNGQAGAPVVGSTFPVTVTAAPNLSPGEHTGAVQVLLCRNSCTQVYSGTTTLPYDITVIPSTNLTPLGSLSGAADWQTLNGNAAHEGYVPVTLDATKFTPRWLWNAMPPNGVVGTVDIKGPVTAANDVIIAEVDQTGSQGAESRLLALQEKDGSVAWQQSVDSGPGAANVSPPGIAAGKVYIAETPDSNLTVPGAISGSFKAFDATNGSPLYSVPVNGAPAAPTNGFNPPAISAYPTPINGSMLQDFQGWYTGPNQASYNFFFHNFDDSSGAAGNGPACLVALEQGNTSQDAFPLPLLPTAAVDAANNAYFVFSGAVLVANYGASGSCKSIVPNQSSSSTLQSDSAPVLVAGNSDVLVRTSAGNLFDYDTVNSKLKWSASGSFAGNPTIAGNVVYIANTSPYQVEVRDEGDGHLLWAWAPSGKGESMFAATMIATNNILFVSTDQQVYAIDLASHRPVWSYSHPGALAISANGILYIARGGMGFVNLSPAIVSDGSLAAINLH